MATRSVMAVADNVDNGFSVVYSPMGSYITKMQPDIPGDAEMLVKKNSVWHLPGREASNKVTHLLAPVEVEPSEGRPGLPGDTTAERNELTEWNEAYDKAVRERRTLPFDRFARYDNNAKRLRGLRA